MEGILEATELAISGLAVEPERNLSAFRKVVGSSQDGHIPLGNLRQVAADVGGVQRPVR